MTGRIRAALLVGTAVLLAAGCTGGPTATTTSSTAAPAAEQPAVNAAVPEANRAQAVAYAGFRAIDPCALHDPAAATTVSGDQVDELLPDMDGLNQCVLR